MKLKLPKVQEENQANIILEINENIKHSLSEIMNIQNEPITDSNENDIKNILNKVDLIIVECHTSKVYKINKNADFSRLAFEYQGLKLKYESYQLNKQINRVNEEYKKIENQQNNLKEESNNLIYNILGFIASFSVVSAAVSAIDEIKSLPQIMLFMAFTAFILITTLIGLNNFYKKHDKKTCLQNNYFLWKMLLVVIILLMGYMGVESIAKKSDYILETIGRGIGQTINLNEESNKNDNLNNLSTNCQTK